jgi:hypothetical protein
MEIHSEFVDEPKFADMLMCRYYLIHGWFVEVVYPHM